MLASLGFNLTLAGSKHLKDIVVINVYKLHFFIKNAFYIYISQGIIATRFKCDATFNGQFMNLLLSVAVKGLWKSVTVWWIRTKIWWLTFWFTAYVQALIVVYLISLDVIQTVSEKDDLHWRPKFAWFLIWFGSASKTVISSSVMALLLGLLATCPLSRASQDAGILGGRHVAVDVLNKIDEQ